MPDALTKFEDHKREIEEQLRLIAPEALATRLSGLIRPAIALGTSPSEGELPPLASKLGGSPDVPLGFEWPMCEGQPLSFVAQLNLEELAYLDVENRLPKSGLLSFWANEMLAVDFMSEYQSNGAGRVFHFQSAQWQGLLTSQVTPHDNLQVFPPAAVQPQTWASVANVWGNAEFSNEEFDLQLWEALYALRFPAGHQMFGFPDSIQDDPRCEASWGWSKFLYSPTARQLGLSPEHDEIEWAEWELLLQVKGDDNANMFWGDGGAIYFMMRRSDLEAGKFERCWFVFQC